MGGSPVCHSPAAAPRGPWGGALPLPRRPPHHLAAEDQGSGGGREEGGRGGQGTKVRVWSGLVARMVWVGTVRGECTALHGRHEVARAMAVVHAVWVGRWGGTCLVNAWRWHCTALTYVARQWPPDQSTSRGQCCTSNSKPLEMPALQVMGSCGLLLGESIKQH